MMRRIFLLLGILGACAGDPDEGLRIVALHASPSEMVFGVDDTFSIRAIGEDAEGYRRVVEASWSSSDPVIVSVDEQGVALGKGVGEAVLTAVHGGLRAEAKIRVLERVAALWIVPEEVRLHAGDEIELQLVAADSQGLRIDRRGNWATADARVATVDDGGRLRGEGVGETEVQAEAEGVLAVARVQVDPHPAHEIEIVVPDLRWEVGTSFELEAIVRDREGKRLDDMKVRWEAAAPTLLSLTPEGVGTFRRPGRTSAIARSGPVEARLELEGYLRYRQLVRNTDSVGEAPTACGLDGAGHAFCHGDNSHGQLGDKSLPASDRPVRVANAPPFVRIETPRPLKVGSIALRSFGGITADGRLFRWGEGAPAGNWVDLPYGVVRRIERPWKDSRGGSPDGGEGREGMRFCDLTDRGAAVCHFGQATREGPVAPPGADPEPLHAPIVDIAGARLFCWLYETGEVSCHAPGTSGGGVPFFVGHPIALPEAATALAAAGHSVCALGESGSLHCWQQVHELVSELGANHWEYRGISPVFSAAMPAPVTRLFEGEDRICGLEGVKVHCWDLAILTNGELDDSSWLGFPYPLDLGGLAIEDLDLFSGLARDVQGRYWALGEPPTLLPHQH